MAAAVFLSDVAFPVVNEQPNVYSLSLDSTGDCSTLFADGFGNNLLDWSSAVP